jgi:hypothetical protein
MKSSSFRGWSVCFLILVSLLVWLSSASAKVIFKADFETGDLSEWNKSRIGNYNVKSIEIVTDVVQQGKYAGKFTMHEYDIRNESQLRVQVGGPEIEVQEGTDTYMSFYIYMAEPAKERDSFLYWEGKPPPRWNNVMTWSLEPKEGGGTVMKYTASVMGGRKGLLWQTDFTLGKWHQLAMHIHWSEDAEKGHVKLWFDGALSFDEKVKTKGPETVYFCQPGIFRSPHRPSVDTIYFDNFIVADTLEEIMKEVPKPNSDAPAGNAGKKSDADSAKDR